MTILFYFLWTIALAKVLVGPTIHAFSKFIFSFLILIGVWVVIGAVIYHSQYAEYLVKKREFEMKKDTYLKSEKELESIAQDHPTSRDVLLQLASISYQLGKHEKLLNYIERLRKVDPNNVNVKAFIQSVQ